MTLAEHAAKRGRYHERMIRLPHVALAILAVALAGCSSGPSASRRGGASDTSVVVPVSVGQLKRQLARPGANATVLNVWATWCVPCREEFPTLLNVARERQRDGVRLVLVSSDFDDQGPAITKFLKQHGVTDTTYWKTGDDMTFINGLSPKWTGALPATFVYDRDGQLTGFWEGRADSMQFEGAISQALAHHSSTEVPKP